MEVCRKGENFLALWAKNYFFTEQSTLDQQVDVLSVGNFARGSNFLMIFVIIGPKRMMMITYALELSAK